MPLNFIDFTVFNFPAGEVHCKLKDELRPYENVLFFQESNPNDLLVKILLANDILKRNNINNVSLYLPYLPYSRQDRPTSKFEPFSLKVIGDLLNTTFFHKIYTLDVHSDSAFACINNLENIKIDFIFTEFLKKYPDLTQKTLVVPDQGAYKRLSKLSEKFSNTVYALKDRDVTNGFLKIKQIVGDIKGEECLIIDDIIDGGGTFVLLADQLYKYGASNVELMATHGIFSKGIDVIKNSSISKIYTTDSFYNSFEEYNNDSSLIYLNCELILNNYIR